MGKFWKVTRHTVLELRAELVTMDINLRIISFFGPWRVGTEIASCTECWLKIFKKLEDRDDGICLGPSSDYFFFLINGDSNEHVESR